MDKKTIFFSSRAILLLWVLSGDNYSQDIMAFFLLFVESQVIGSEHEQEF